MTKLLRISWLAALLLTGCHTAPVSDHRPFVFQNDTFAFPNELYYTYEYAANGEWTTRLREPRPTYGLHCFVVARSALQFFKFARFDPNQPATDGQTYRKLIHRVVSQNPRSTLPESERIVIPGYPNLRAFSLEHEFDLKAVCGGAHQSYFQRGNWRMVFPFSRRLQLHTAERLLPPLEIHTPAVVHLVRFPSLLINHAVLLFDARQTSGKIVFSVYDPNNPGQPRELTFDRASRTFTMPPNNYFLGGRVNVYEIYHGWLY